MGMGPSSTTQIIDKHLVAAQLTDAEILLRRAFVEEFMKTRNGYRACVTLGILAPYAEDWAKSFMAEGYVRQLIHEAERAEESDEQGTERQYRYRAWMEEQATYYGPGSSHGARVTAIGMLMKNEGMEAPIKVETELSHKGGVMLVPALTNANDWCAVAVQSQTKLKDTVKD